MLNLTQPQEAITLKPELGTVEPQPCAFSESCQYAKVLLTFVLIIHQDFARETKNVKGSKLM